MWPVWPGWSPRPSPVASAFSVPRGVGARRPLPRHLLRPVAEAIVARAATTSGLPRLPAARRRPVSRCGCRRCRGCSCRRCRGCCGGCCGGWRRWLRDLCDHQNDLGADVDRLAGMCLGQHCALRLVAVLETGLVLQSHVGEGLLSVTAVLANHIGYLDLALATLRTTADPAATVSPALGSVSITLPLSTLGSSTDFSFPRVRPTAWIAALAEFTLKPVTSGTTASPGPLETVMVTVVFAGYCSPGWGLWSMTLPFSSWLVAVEMAATNPTERSLAMAWSWVRLTTDGSTTLGAAFSPANIALPARPTRTKAATTARVSGAYVARWRLGGDSDGSRPIAGRVAVLC